MAIVVTARASAALEGSASAVQTSAFTPTNGSLLAAVFFAIDDGRDGRIDEAITDSAGLTWTKRITTGNNDDSFAGLHVWTAPVVTGVSMTVSANITSGSIVAKQLQIIEYAGADTASPIGGTVSTVSLGNTTGAQTLSSTPASDSYVLAGRCLAIDDGETASATPGAGWTERYDQTTTDRGGIETQDRTGSTSTSVEWVSVNAAGASNFGCSGFAFEIKAAGGGSFGDGALSAAGANTSSFVGASIAATPVTAAGTGVASLVGASMSGAALSATGANASSFEGQGIGVGEGAVSLIGTGAMTMVGAALTGADLSSAGAGDAAFVGDGTEPGASATIAPLASAELSPSTPDPVTTSTFTPTDNVLLVAVFWAIDDGIDTRSNAVIEDSLGGVWTIRRSTGNADDSFNGIHVWTRPVMTGAPMTVSANISVGGVHAKQLQIVEIGNYDTTEPVGVSSDVTALGDGPGVVTLPTPPGTSSVVLAARCLAMDDGQTSAATPAAGWTELYDMSSADRGGLQSQWRDASADPDCEWDAVNSDGATNFGCSGLAIEFRASGTAVLVSAEFSFAGSSLNTFESGVLVGRPVSVVGTSVAAFEGGTLEQGAVSTAGSGAASFVGEASLVNERNLALAGTSTVSLVGAATGDADFAVSGSADASFVGASITGAALSAAGVGNFFAANPETPVDIPSEDVSSIGGGGGHIGPTPYKPPRKPRKISTLRLGVWPEQPEPQPEVDDLSDLLPLIHIELDRPVSDDSEEAIELLLALAL